MEEAVKEKRRCFKLWKAGDSRAAYNTAKRASNPAVNDLFCFNCGLTSR